MSIGKGDQIRGQEKSHFSFFCPLCQCVQHSEGIEFLKSLLSRCKNICFFFRRVWVLKTVVGGGERFKRLWNSDGLQYLVFFLTWGLCNRGVKEGISGKTRNNGLIWWMLFALAVKVSFSSPSLFYRA